MSLQDVAGLPAEAARLLGLWTAHPEPRGYCDPAARELAAVLPGAQVVHGLALWRHPDGRPQGAVHCWVSWQQHLLDPTRHQFGGAPVALFQALPRFQPPSDSWSLECAARWQASKVRSPQDWPMLVVALCGSTQPVHADAGWAL